MSEYSDQLKQLASEATPGPWVVGDDIAEVVAPCPCCGLVATCAQFGAGETTSSYNSEYIAAANPTAVMELITEIERLREDLAEMTQEAFCEGAYYCNIKDDARYGWWDTCARSSLRSLGDRLVELGGWERDPDGYGRRWFYRPIPHPGGDDE